jgi:hypothetical protein
VHLNLTNLFGKTFNRFIIPPHTGHPKASPFMRLKTTHLMPQPIEMGVRLNARSPVSECSEHLAASFLLESG